MSRKSSKIIEIVNARRLAIIYAQLELPQVRIFDHLLPFWVLLSFYDHLNKNVIHFKPDLYLKVYLEKLSSKHPFHLFWNFYVVDRFLTVSFVDVYIAYAKLLCPIWPFPGSGLTIRGGRSGLKNKIEWVADESGKWGFGLFTFGQIDLIKGHFQPLKYWNWFCLVIMNLRN